MVAEILELVRAGANRDTAMRQAIGSLVAVTGAIGERVGPLSSLIRAYETKLANWGYEPADRPEPSYEELKARVAEMEKRVARKALAKKAEQAAKAGARDKKEAG
jgi:hypothetical protein